MESARTDLGDADNANTRPGQKGKTSGGGALNKPTESQITAKEKLRRLQARRLAERNERKKAVRNWNDRS